MKHPTLRRFIGAAVTASLISIGAVVGALLPSAANSMADLSNVGEKAFQDLTTCLTSGKSKKIDVIYLIDKSGSLRWTDPDEVRREILSKSLAQLGSFAEQGIKVSVASALFSGSVEVVQDWKVIGNQSDADQAAATLAKVVSNQNADGFTNWAGALSFAEREFEAAGDSCKALIWFTDGGINRDNSLASRIIDIAMLCHSGIAGGGLQYQGSDKFGLMSRLKAAGVTVFGVLYNNEDSTFAHRIREGDSPQQAQDYVESELYWMSYMKPLVEGFGKVYSENRFQDVPEGGELQCNELSEGNTAATGYSNGAFLNAVDPISLAFQFLKIQAQISGGSQSKIVDGKFEIKPGTASFQILTTSENWSVSGPEGSSFSATNSSAPAPNVSISNSAGVTTVEINVDEEEENFVGVWSLDTAVESSSELYVFSGLTLFLDRDKSSKIIAGRANTLSGKIVREPRFEGRLINLSKFEKREIALSVLENGEYSQVLKVTPESDGQFKIENFTPTFSGVDSIELLLTLDLGGDFQLISSKFNLSLVDKAAFAFASQDLIQLSPLTGPEGVALGVFLVNGPNVNDSSEYCIAGVAERTDDAQTGVEKVDRSALFAWTFMDTRSGGGEASFTEGADQQPFCFPVGKEESVSVAVEVRNPQQADSNVISIRPVRSVASGVGASFEESLRFEFDSTTEQNDFVVALVIGLLLLIGLIGPLALLFFWNLISTKFVWAPGMVRAEYPILLTNGAAASSIQDARPSASGSRLNAGPQDFAFVEDRQDPRAIEDEPQGQLRARVPLFPLAQSWFEWRAPAGSRILSLAGEGVTQAKVLEAGKTTEVSPRMAENWAIVVPETELSNEESKPLKATLVVYSAMASLAEYQKKLTAISNKAGLQAAMSAIRTSYAEDLTKVEVKKAKRGKQVDQQEFTESTNTGLGVPGLTIPGVDAKSTSTSSISIPGISGGTGQTDFPLKSGDGSLNPSIDIPGIPKSPNDK